MVLRTGLTVYNYGALNCAPTMDQHHEKGKGTCMVLRSGINLYQCSTEEYILNLFCLHENTVLFIIK